MFLSPLWLALLIPWLALLGWMLQGRRPRVDVPFVRLWRGAEVSPSAKRALRAPPLPIVFLLLATLAGILALASPVLRRSGKQVDPQQILVIVDTGMTMTSQAGPTRLQQTLDLSRQSLVDSLGDVRFRIRRVPGESGEGNLDELLKVSQDTFPAYDTRETLGVVVAQALADSGIEAIIVFSDQSIPTTDPRLIQISPESPLDNAGIVGFSASVAGDGQVMVRVRNDSSAGKAMMRVSSGNVNIGREIALPERSKEASYFFTLAQLEKMVRVELVLADDVLADNVAHLVRGAGSARVEVSGNPAPALQKFLTTYRQFRPADAFAPVVRILIDEDLENGSGPAVQVTRPPASETVGQEDVTVATHPVVENLSPEAFKKTTGASLSSADWTPLVSRNAQTLLAVREIPEKQVWVGFDPEAWAESVKFVVLWTNILDWCGGGESEYVAFPLPPVPLDGRNSIVPGLADESGVVRAYNVSPILPVSAGDGRWREQMAVLNRSRVFIVSLRGLLSVVAMLLTIAAICTWPRGNLTAFSARRTV